jgi:hypothetical protein
MDIFFKVSTFLSVTTFCVCADGFKACQKLFITGTVPYTFINFLLASLEITYLLILTMLTETLLRILFSVICRCSLVPTSQWLQIKCARINLSQAASGMILHKVGTVPFYYFEGGFLGFCSFYVHYSTLICRSSGSAVSEDVGIEPITVGRLALTARRSNH